MFSKLTKLGHRFKDRRQPSKSTGSSKPIRSPGPPKHASLETRNYDPVQTLQLAKLFCTKDISRMHETNNIPEFAPYSSTPGFLAQLRRLLDDGANPSVLVNVYAIIGRNFHRLTGADDRADFFEGSYTRCFEDNFMSSSEDADWIPERPDSKDLQVFLSCMRTPLADAAYTKDHETVLLLTEHGARLSNFAEKVEEPDVSGRSEHNKMLYAYNPFLPAIHAKDSALLEILLGDRKEGLGAVGKWLDQGMTAALRIASPPVRDFDMAVMLAKQKIVGIETRLPAHPSREIIDFIMMLEIEKAVLSREGYEISTAVVLDHELLYSVMMNNGVDIHTRSRSGLSALHVAVGNENIGLCEHLIRDGLDIGARDIWGMSPFLESVYYGHVEALKLLLTHGTNPADHAEDGWPEWPVRRKVPLHSRLEGPWRRRRDLAAEVFMNKRWSALHIAAHRGFTSIVNLLIHEGADIAAEDLDGCTALDIAMRSSNSPTAFSLLSSGCPMNANAEAASGLMAHAVQGGNFGAVRRLAQRGVKLLEQDEFLEHMILEGQDLLLEPNKRTVATRLGPTTTSINLCARCSSALLNDKTDTSERLTDWTCSLCRLGEDCAVPENGSFAWVAYVDHEGPRDLLLELGFKGYQRMHSLKMIPYDWHDVLQRMGRKEDNSTASAAAIYMARHWLENCVQGHLQCNRHGTSSYTPTRVVDISGIDDGKHPRLIQHSHLQGSYVALSHRWGNDGLPITTSANLAARLRALPLDELSQTMRDAIHIVRELGYHYIWIDALCIVQDSAEDWLHEASRMSSVFSGAVLTIAVADADHHAQGIFRPRRGCCIRPFYVPYFQGKPFRERTQFDGEGEFYVFPTSEFVSGGNRLKGTLDTRAWILQEQLLSPRVLYYGDGEIYWDCITVSASESSPISASLLQDVDPDETWALKLIRRTLAGSTNTETLRTKIADIWTQIIKNYSARNLTRQSDKLIALEGILVPLAKILRDDPVAGMWRHQLWRQLIWWVATPCPVGLTDPQGMFSAPSWSWLNVTSPVHYHNAVLRDVSQHDASAHKFTDLEPLSTVLSADISVASSATHIHSRLTIRGPSFSYRLTANDLKKSVYKSWNTATLHLNTGIWMLDRAAELPLNLECIIIAEDSVAKMLVLMCLVPHEQETGTWKRVGLCHWDGLAWQVPKYIGMEADEKTFTIV